MKKPAQINISKKVQTKILQILAQREVPIHYYEGDVVRFGLLGDTHIGSLYEHNDVLVAAYNLFQKEGIKTVYHCGDILDGTNMHRGMEYEQYAHGAKMQVKACVERYPKIPGITTYYILGNHDNSYKKLCDLDIDLLIGQKRKDLICLGRDAADILVGDKFKAHIKLLHAGDGSAYAISYKPQKHIESLSGGRKPQAIFFGHWHKSFYMPCYRNVFAISVGCIQGQTPFMQSKNLSAHIGFWIVEFVVNENNSIRRFKAEFFAHYEEQLFANA